MTSDIGLPHSHRLANFSFLEHQADPENFDPWDHHHPPNPRASSPASTIDHGPKA